MTEKTAARVMPLEGLRGLAAISVVMYHFLVLIFPAMYYGSVALRHSRFEDNIHGNPLASLVSGDFAVSIFFVLSGFVLTVGYFQTKNTGIIKRLATRRYLRLMVPALASVLIAWLFIVLGLSHIQQAYTITQSSALNLSWVQNTSFLKAIYEGSIGVFTSGSVFNYNSVLWTMQYEFLGSFIVFALAVLVGKSKYRAAVYLCASIALVNTWFLGFIFGMMIADLYANREWIIEKIHPLVATIMIIAAIFLGAFPWAGVNETIYKYMVIPGFSVLQNQATWGALGAALLILAIFRLRLLSRILSSRHMTKIGAHTYSLYLVHQPIIYTLGMALFVFFAHRTGYSLAAMLTFLFILPVIAFATIMFHKYIELPAVHLSSLFDRLMNNEIALSTLIEYEKRNILGGYARIKRTILGLARKEPSQLVEEEIE